MSQPIEARANGPSTATRRVIVIAPPGNQNPMRNRLLLLLLMRAAETAEEPIELEVEPETTHQPEPVEA